MAFAGVSVIADGNLLSGSTMPTFNAAAASGYHLLVVEGYSCTYQPTQSITSRTFTIGGHRWSIIYYPNGSRTDDAGFISLYLSNQDYSSPKTAVNARFEFSFIDETEKQEPARVRARRIFEISSTVGYNRFVKRDVLQKSKHLQKDSFIIRCDVVVDDMDVTTPLIEVPPSEMKQNFSDLLLAREGTDVVFRVGDETFAAHRCVLAARSAVFKASLLGSMKEGSTSTVVQIDDMDATVFKAMLGFIYGDSLPVPAEGDKEQEDGVLFQHLLVAADRYGLRRLKAMCEKKLREHIGVSTTTTILALAEQHRCDGLKEACYEFLRFPANLKAVVATEGFDHLCTSCPTVMKGLIVAVGVPQAPK